MILSLLLVGVVTEKAFLRWAGGKSNYLNIIAEHLPKSNLYDRYFEPFLGAGSLFFRIKPRVAILSDLNDQLISAYRSIQTRPKLISQYLLELYRNDSEAVYYIERDNYNRLGTSYKQSARFIYLNQHCFNGIFRVNQKGEFNVPYGHKKSPRYVTLDELNRISILLQNAHLRQQDYRATLSDAKSTDFIYLDPPYPPVNGTSYFTHYTKERFSIKDQEEVAEEAVRLSALGCKVLISNADTEQIRSLYRNWDIINTQTTRYVTSKKVKHKVNELLIKNY